MKKLKVFRFILLKNIDILLISFTKKNNFVGHYFDAKLILVSLKDCKIFQMKIQSFFKVKIIFCNYFIIITNLQATNLTDFQCGTTDHILIKFMN